MATTFFCLFTSVLKSVSKSSFLKSIKHYQSDIFLEKNRRSLFPTPKRFTLNDICVNFIYSFLLKSRQTMPVDQILHPLRLQSMAREWLLEDSGAFDYGGGVVGDRRCEFTIYQKGRGLLAGVPFANAVFQELSVRPMWLRKEGELIDPVCEVARVSGPARNLLLAERIVLNVLSRASGVATAAGMLREVVEGAGWCGRVAGSRKTTPGFRAVEKYGLLVAGVDPHRYDLSSMVMLKDNHVCIAGSIEQVLETVGLICLTIHLHYVPNHIYITTTLYVYRYT